MKRCGFQLLVCGRIQISWQYIQYSHSISRGFFILESKSVFCKADVFSGVFLIQQYPTLIRFYRTYCVGCVNKNTPWKLIHSNEILHWKFANLWKIMPWKCTWSMISFFSHVCSRRTREKPPRSRFASLLRMRITLKCDA